MSLVFPQAFPSLLIPLPFVLPDVVQLVPVTFGCCWAPLEARVRNQTADRIHCLTRRAFQDWMLQGSTCGVQRTVVKDLLRLVDSRKRLARKLSLS